MDLRVRAAYAVNGNRSEILEERNAPPYKWYDETPWKREKKIYSNIGRVGISIRRRGVVIRGVAVIDGASKLNCQLSSSSISYGTWSRDLQARQ